MKIIRLSLILFFLFTSNIFAKDVYLSCESPTQVKLSFVINDEKEILILNGVEREVVNWTKEYISFWVSDQFKAIQEISEPRNFKPDTLDRIAGSYGIITVR